jgi:hypothetical protein
MLRGIVGLRFCYHAARRQVENEPEPSRFQGARVGEIQVIEKLVET